MKRQRFNSADEFWIGYDMLSGKYPIYGKGWSVFSVINFTVTFADFS